MASWFALWSCPSFACATSVLLVFHLLCSFPNSCFCVRIFRIGQDGFVELRQKKGLASAKTRFASALEKVMNDCVARAICQMCGREKSAGLAMKGSCKHLSSFTRRASDVQQNPRYDTSSSDEKLGHSQPLSTEPRMSRCERSRHWWCRSGGWSQSCRGRRGGRKKRNCAPTW